MSLDARTPIPTPTGWTAAGQLGRGARVFDEAGRVCLVLEAHEVPEPGACYGVRFWDGVSLVVDSGQMWRTRAYVTGRGTGQRWLPDDNVTITERIRQTLTLEREMRSRGRTSWNHSVLVAGSLDLPSLPLTVDPFLLGVWLGDGSSYDARFTVGFNDLALVAELRRRGIEVSERPTGNAGSTEYRFGSGDRRQAARDVSVKARLRALGLIGNKHIPPRYLRAGAEQRLDLLRGLMDTDGYAEGRGTCEFTTTSRTISRGVLELIRTLGLKPNLVAGRASIKGRDCGPKYRITFRAYSDCSVFTLPRKTARLKPPPSRVSRSMRRSIVGVDTVEPRPMRKIRVDSPSGMYLAGQGFVAVHHDWAAAEKNANAE